MNTTHRRYPRTSLEAFPGSYPEAFEGHIPRKEPFVYRLIFWLSVAIIIGLPACIYLEVI